MATSAHVEMLFNRRPDAIAHDLSSDHHTVEDVSAEGVCTRAPPPPTRA